MKPLRWEKQYETGHPLMDAQHELLVQKINACIEASRQGQTTGELIILLEEIARDLEAHFHDEEKILRQLDRHPEFHLNQHSYACENMKKQIEMLKQGNCGSLSIQGVAFPLYEWYVTHLMHEDLPLLSSGEA